MRLWLPIRNWLLRLLAGRSTVVINAKFDYGDLIIDSPGAFLCRNRHLGTGIRVVQKTAEEAK